MASCGLETTLFTKVYSQLFIYLFYFPCSLWRLCIKLYSCRGYTDTNLIRKFCSWETLYLAYKQSYGTKGLDVPCSDILYNLQQLMLYQLLQKAEKLKKKNRLFRHLDCHPQEKLITLQSEVGKVVEIKLPLLGRGQRSTASVLVEAHAPWEIQSIWGKVLPIHAPFFNPKDHDPAPPARGDSTAWTPFALHLSLHAKLNISPPSHLIVYNRKRIFHWKSCSVKLGCLLFILNTNSSSWLVLYSKICKNIKLTPPGIEHRNDRQGHRDTVSRGVRH